MDSSQTWQTNVHNCLELVGVVILYYDHAVTIGSEYHLVWKQAQCVSRVLFLANRYFSFFTAITVVVGNLIPFISLESVRGGSIFLYDRVSRLNVSLAAPNSLFTVKLFWVYGLYSRARWVLVLFTMVGIAAAIISLFALTGQKTDVVVQGGCHTALTQSSAIRIAASWETLFVFDILVFTLTVAKTAQMRRNQLSTKADDLVTLVFRDGKFCIFRVSIATGGVCKAKYRAEIFGIDDSVLACVNAANICTFYFLPVRISSPVQAGMTDSPLQPILKGSLSTTVGCLSTTVLSRIMLNIHDRAASNDDNSVDLSLNWKHTSRPILTSRISLPPPGGDAATEDERDRLDPLLSKGTTHELEGTVCPFKLSSLFALNHLIHGSRVIVAARAKLHKYKQHRLYRGLGPLRPGILFRGVCCNLYSEYRQVATGLIELIVTGNLFLRVYALHGRSKRILGLLMLAFCGALAICVWGFLGSGTTTEIDYGCHIYLSTGISRFIHRMTLASSPHYAAGFAAAWEALLALDVLIFLLTFSKARTAIREPRIRAGGGLLVLMFKDGALYYIVLTCANLANIITFYVLPPALKGCFAAVVNRQVLDEVLQRLSRPLIDVTDLNSESQAPLFTPVTSFVLTEMPSMMIVAEFGMMTA
ncbi:hypothetical protein NM688_g1076 [Phlebia brevispora]|uniref:Uncharacterized protein n=1 Tax=Phlebia brevispora TaxID=194682 RepID=A0ACC1TCU4_9APHY|nr:hypothetical protein NM688_g1076 [Phlebia brevispora]